jgi:ABC-type antimicrobial peptide transport system permease subunit
VFGLLAGVTAAIKRGSIFDHGVMGISLTGFSMPIFWWGLILIMFFSVKLGWTPVSGRLDLAYDITPRTGFMLIDTWLAEAADPCQCRCLQGCADASDSAGHRAGYHSAGGDCADDPFLHAGSAA